MSGRKSPQKRPIWRRIGNVRFAETGWWCAQSTANPSPCYLTNIRVFFENNSELAAKIVKDTCGAGVSLILRNFDIREEQGAAHCRYTEAALSEQRSGKKRIRIGWSRLVRPRRGIRLAIGQGETGASIGLDREMSSPIQVRKAEILFAAGCPLSMSVFEVRADKLCR